MKQNFKLNEFKVLDAEVNLVHQFENACIIVELQSGLKFAIIQELSNSLSSSESTNKTFEFTLSQIDSCCRIGNKGYVFNFTDNSCYTITFQNHYDTNSFHNFVQKGKDAAEKTSKFCNRTDESSATQYFQFYGYLSQQQNMLQDYIRTSTYERAVLSNSVDFQDKIVLDVGAGSGILSFFAVQAGASKVYAVEASSMAEHAESLVRFNYLSDKISVIAGKIEEIDLPDQVDIIISEPMGYMLYNERMLETYLHAKKWLKKGGKMFPTIGDLHIAPFTDEALFIEQTTKASFWLQTHFHNIDLTALHDAALNEYFRQPVVDTFDIRTCTARSICHTVNFLEADENDLHRIEIPLEFNILQTATVHGLAFWFDVAFIGSSQTVWLSTSPTEALTHWYQVRCLLTTPIFVRVDQKLVGTVILEANPRQSYDVNIDVMIDGVPDTRSINRLDLKNPYFRYTGQPAAPPPGLNNQSPTETYWNQMEAQQNATRQVSDVTFDITQWSSGQAVPVPMNTLNNTVNMVNGISLNGYGEVLEVPMQQQLANMMTPQLIAAHAQQSIPNSVVPVISGNNRCRQRTTGQTVPTSTCGAQLIGGGITPTMLTNHNASSQIGGIISEANQFPISNASEMVTEVNQSNDVNRCM